MYNREKNKVKVKNSRGKGSLKGLKEIWYGSRSNGWKRELARCLLFEVLYGDEAEKMMLLYPKKVDLSL